MQIQSYEFFEDQLKLQERAHNTTLLAAHITFHIGAVYGTRSLTLNLDLDNQAGIEQSSDCVGQLHYHGPFPYHYTLCMTRYRAVSYVFEVTGWIYPNGWGLFLSKRSVLPHVCGALR
jgi:hypothetical protein